MADLDFYGKLLRMDAKLRDANLDLFKGGTDNGKKLRDDKLPFLLQSRAFQDCIANAREKLGLKNDEPIYSEPSSSAIQSLMRTPSREELIELGLIPYNTEEASESQKLVEKLQAELRSEKDPEVIELIKKDIEEMSEGATGYLGYHDEESRKRLYTMSVVRQILDRFSLGDSWYAVIENVVLNGSNYDEAYPVSVPDGIVIQEIAQNGDVIVRVSQGSTKQEYVKAWEYVSHFTGTPRKLPKTSSNTPRDLEIIRDMDAGIPTSQVASKYFPDKPQDTDLYSHIHKIYKRKSVK